MKFEVKDSIVHLVLDQAQRGNSIGTPEAKVLEELLKVKNLQGLICYSKSDQFFCTGGNLKEQAHASSKATSLKVQKKIRQLFHQLSNTPYPKVAIVSGNCFGGGMEFMSCFDYIISSPHSYFGLWQRKLGLSFGWGGGERLLKRLHQAQLFQLLYTARSISAYEAKTMGLIDEVLPAYLSIERAKSFINNTQKWPNNFEKIKKWPAKNSSQIFEKLWMNKDHLKVLKKHL